MTISSRTPEGFPTQCPVCAKVICLEPALNPSLVMGLVGSLCFFLLEVLYAGQYSERMMLILFFFVVAVVLITRISVTAEIADRTGLYGAILGVLVYIGLQRFVSYP